MRKVYFRIIIPNYNGMAYVRQCLDSVFSQTCGDFFVVFVDDGSTDFSDRVADVYARRHPDRMAVLRPGRKLYAGGCRNAGMEYPLESEYTCYVDSDDYLLTDRSLEILKTAVEKAGKPGLVLFNWVKDLGGGKMFRKNFPDYRSMLSKMANSLWCAGWTRLTKTEFAEPFLEGCMHGEDTYQFLRILDRSPSILQIPDEIYAYRIQPDSTIRSAVATGKGLYYDTKPIFYNAITELRKTAATDTVRASIDYRLEHRI